MEHTGGGEAVAERIVVLGGEFTGVATAERVHYEYEDVWFLDGDPQAVEAAAALGATTEVVDVTDGEALEAVLEGSTPIELAIVTVEPDATALLVGQTARTRLDAKRVVALYDEPRNRVAFETAGMIPVCTTTAAADAVLATLPSELDQNRPRGPTASTETPGSPRTRRTR